HKIITNYNKETLVDFKRFTLTKRSFLKPWLLYILCIGVVVLAFLYNRRFELNFTTVIYPSIAIIGGLIITYLYYIRPQREAENTEEFTAEYIFGDTAVTVGEDEIPYSDFYCIYEDKAYFYFYVNEADGFLIDKDDLDFDMGEFLKGKDIKAKQLKLMKSKPQAEKEKFDSAIENEE
ncbi:MAG: YcxB family protein, partial [Ruminococcus sp.]